MNSSPVTVSEATARAGRTAPQGGLAWALTEGVDAFFYDMTDRQYGVLIVLLTIVFAFVQAAIENGIGKALLRNVPPFDAPVADADETPVVEDVDGKHEAGVPTDEELRLGDEYAAQEGLSNPYRNWDGEQEDYR